MKYCRTCLIPNTKPHIRFDENGVCSACLAHRLKNQRETGIDWHRREQEFERLVLDAKSRNAEFFDVLVPVSGGKDSITQVHRLLKFDLRILAVNVDYGIKTEVGRSNLDLIPNMGAHLIIFRPELTLHRRLIRLGFEDFGDPDLLSHTLLHAAPLHVALQFQVPLVLLGENSAFEYGGDAQVAENNSMTRSWFAKFAANNGRDARFIGERYHLALERLRLYDYPDKLEQSGTRAVFLSHFFHWDSENHLKIAAQHGFQSLAQPGEGTYRNFVGIDEKINRIHQYMKVLKFGYGRATDHACEDIRNGRFTREAAKTLVRKHDLQELSDSFINDFIQFVGFSRKNFFEIMERYRNREIWQKNPDGQWCIPGHLED